MVQRNENGKFVCKKCKTHFSSRTSRDAHEARHHNGKKVPCKAAGCEEVFNDRTIMNRHFRTMHGKARVPYWCRVCKKELSPRRDNALRHMKQCATCTKNDIVPTPDWQEQLHTAPATPETTPGPEIPLSPVANAAAIGYHPASEMQALDQQWEQQPPPPPQQQPMSQDEIDQFIADLTAAPVNGNGQVEVEQQNNSFGFNTEPEGFEPLSPVSAPSSSSSSSPPPPPPALAPFSAPAATPLPLVYKLADVLGLRLVHPHQDIWESSGYYWIWNRFSGSFEILLDFGPGEFLAETVDPRALTRVQ